MAGEACLQDSGSLFQRLQKIVVAHALDQGHVTDICKCCSCMRPCLHAPKSLAPMRLELKIRVPSLCTGV